MNYISTTDLRTKSSQLVHALLNGNSLYLVHRSKIVGEIKPAQAAAKQKPFNAKRFFQLARKLNLPKLSDEKLERNYRDHMEKKYGKRIS